MSQVRRLAITIFALAIAAGAVFSCREGDPPAPAPDPPPAAAGGTAQPFAGLVGSDVFCYLGLRDWKALEIFDFIQTARRLKIAQRLKEIMDPGLGGLPRSESAGLRLGRLAELRQKVSLRELLGGEWALALFPGEPSAPPVGALILRLPEGEAGDYAEYFRELIALSPFGDEAGEVAEIDFSGRTIYTFPLPGEETRAAWCRSGDILVAATDRKRVEKIVSRQLGREGGPALAGNRAFRESFRGLDPGARGVFYLEIRPLAASLAEAVADFELHEGGQAVYYLGGLLRAIGTVERIAGNFDFDPRAYREEFRLYLDEAGGSRALLDLLTIPPRSWEVLNYIPAGVADFSAGFLAPEKVYRPLTRFIAAGPGGGGELVKIWEEKQEEAGIRVEEDILSWLGDEFAFCTVTLGRSLFDPGGWAFLGRCASPGDLDRFLSGLARRARAEDLNVVEEEYGGWDFYTLYLPVPLFPVTPAAGRVGEFFVLASRRDILTGIVDTYDRREPSIRQDPDFQRLESRLGDRGSAIYFSRLEDKIEALISLIRSSASLVALLLPPPGAEDESGEIAGPDSRQVIELLNDITRVLDDFKIFRFRAGVSLYRDGYLQTRSVVEIGD